MNTSFLVGETSMSFLKGVRLYKVGGKIGRKGDREFSATFTI